MKLLLVVLGIALVRERLSRHARSATVDMHLRLGRRAVLGGGVRAVLIGRIALVRKLFVVAWVAGGGYELFCLRAAGSTSVEAV